MRPSYPLARLCRSSGILVCKSHIFAVAFLIGSLGPASASLLAQPQTFQARTSPQQASTAQWNAPGGQPQSQLLPNPANNGNGSAPVIRGQNRSAAQNHGPAQSRSAVPGQMGAGSEWNAPAINPLGENPTNALPAQNAVVPASGEQVVASMPDAADRASKLDGGHNGSGTPLDISSADPTATKQGSGGVFGALVSIGSSFVIVMALFLGVAWFYRKTVATTMGNSLPKQVVEVLGRSSIAARQQLVLVRFGPKLVLVSMVQGETRMISEITDPVEVDKLTGQCESAKAGSSVQSFKSVFAQGGRAS